MIADTYLIQRARFTGENGDLDRLFSWSYMGSAEFEFGTLPRSIRALRLWHRDHAPLLVDRITWDSHKAWYVGPSDRKSAAEKVLAEELGQAEVFRKECTHMRAAYGLGGHHSDPEDCWLAVNDRLQRNAASPPPIEAMPFGIFKRKKAAIKFFNAIVVGINGMDD